MCVLVSLSLYQTKFKQLTNLSNYFLSASLPKINIKITTY